MNIYKYLHEYFEGNKAEFARQFGRKPQNVQMYFQNQKDYIIMITDKRDMLMRKISSRASTFYTKEGEEYKLVRKKLYQVIGERLK